MLADVAAGVDAEPPLLLVVAVEAELVGAVVEAAAVVGVDLDELPQAASSAAIAGAARPSAAARFNTCRRVSTPDMA